MEKLQSKVRARYAFAAYLGQQGMRCTPERLLVLDAAMDSRKPFTAESLLADCSGRAGQLTVCRATVFNTLPLLVRAGVVRQMPLPGGITYEAVRSSSAQQPKVMLVCSSCGKVSRHKSRPLGLWVGSQTFRDFAPREDSAVLYVYGECLRCRKKHMNIKTKIQT